MKEIRRNSDDYKEIKDGLIHLKKDFKIIETKHTKRIKTKNQQIFFSKDKKCFYELALINYVKKDAKEYAQQNNISNSNLNKINFYYYNRINENETKYFDVWKLDITSAYWQLAINENIISNKTIDYFNQNKDNFVNGHKPARLKALGALATEKIVSEYKDGVLIDKGVNRNELSRNLYIFICEKIDDLMKIITYKYREYVVYYYWDCFFISKDAPLKKIQKDILDYGFQTKFENDSVLINENEQHPFILSMKNKHHYPINKIDIQNGVL